MAAPALLVLPSTTAASQSVQSLHCYPRPAILVNSLFRNRLWLRPSNWRPILRKQNVAIATVSFSLPTTVFLLNRKPDRAPAETIPKWSERAIKSFAMAELEARKLKYPNTGTEALLMGILVEGTSLAAKFLRANGITLFKVREETIK
uniref:Clp R domain-containing protein n=1 Tax=Nelumbo nucifera TaxID=4432 RepID=A0A822YSK2_NELNU|nr:TPA_asm: hypothetical protein HUJ06_012607 [Nelumbo nucifera]